MCRRAAFNQNRKGVGTGEFPFDRKTRTALEAGSVEPGIGYARTHGNFRAEEIGSCVKDVPGAKRVEEVLKLMTC